MFILTRILCSTRISFINMVLYKLINTYITVERFIAVTVGCTFDKIAINVCLSTDFVIIYTVWFLIQHIFNFVVYL